MSRSTLILIVSIYGLLVVLGMLVAPATLLQDFGIPAPDKYHLALYKLMGMPILGLCVVGLMIRNAEPSLGLRAFLTGQAVNLIGFVALSAYESIGRDIPVSTLFLVDSLWRLALGLGLVYHLTRLKPVVGMA